MHGSPSGRRKSPTDAALQPYALALARDRLPRFSRLSGAAPAALAHVQHHCICAPAAKELRSTYRKSWNCHVANSGDKRMGRVNQGKGRQAGRTPCAARVGQPRGLWSAVASAARHRFGCGKTILRAARPKSAVGAALCRRTAMSCVNGGESARAVFFLKAFCWFGFPAGSEGQKLLPAWSAPSGDCASCYPCSASPNASRRPAAPNLRFIFPGSACGIWSRATL